MDYQMTAERVKEMVTYLAKEFVNDNGLASIATLETGVINGDKLAQLKQGGFGNVAISTGCDPEYTTATMAEKKEWKLGDYSMNLNWCVTDIEAELRRAKNLYDLTDEEVFNQFVTDFLQKSFVESIFAMDVFGATGSTVNGLKASEAGIIEQAIALVANGDAKASQAVSIATNTKAGLRNGTTAIDVLFDVVDAMSPDLKRQENKYIMCGENFFADLAYCCRMAKSAWNTDQYEELSNGYKKYVFDGITLIVNPFIDPILEVIDGTLAGKRAVLFASAPQYIHIGTKQSESNTCEANVWYEKKDKKVYATMDYNSGALIGSNHDFVIAY